MSEESYQGPVYPIHLPKGAAGYPAFEGLQVEIRAFLTKKQTLTAATAGMNVAKVTGQVVAAQRAEGASEETIEAAMSDSLEVDVGAQATGLVRVSAVRWRIGNDGNWIACAAQPLEDSIDDVTHDAIKDLIEAYYDPEQDVETFPSEGAGSPDSE